MSEFIKYTDKWIQAYFMSLDWMILNQIPDWNKTKFELDTDLNLRYILISLSQTTDSIWNRSQMQSELDNRLTLH